MLLTAIFFVIKNGGNKSPDKLIFGNKIIPS
jgi:hypothetical protein